VNLRLRPAGVLVNRVRSNLSEHRYRIDELREVYGDMVLDPVIPERSAVQQAQGAGVPVQAWRSPGAAEVSDAYDDILDRLLA
jgi:cellulose biosynthesis protein BcsQ